MPRDRFQRGTVRQTGKTVRKWRGEYYVYVKDENGAERREHRSVILGAKADLKKWEAERALQDIIDTHAGLQTGARPDSSVTFEWFWRNRFLPIKNWRSSTQSSVVYVMENHVLPNFGAQRLRDISKFDLQTHVNSMAAKYSKSLVDKVRTWTRAVLEEAVEQEYLTKNPGRKLTMPPTRDTCKRFLTADEYKAILNALGSRDRLIVRLFVMCAFRPGELFALRWRNFDGAIIRIEEAVYRGRIGKPKTKGSTGAVLLPESLAEDLRRWYDRSGRPEPDSLIFPSGARTPLDAHNYLQRDVLKPAAKRIGITGITFQALRRTFATHFHGIGTVKDQQTQMRHANASTTLNIYTQSIPDSLRYAMEQFDKKMANVLNTIEHNSKGGHDGSD